mgnify:FL=1|jgi:DNA-binding CsgD family transcriptional regulator/PAS domain-containing protein
MARGRLSFDAAIGLLYDAAAGGASWGDALDGVRQLFGAVDTHALVFDERTCAVHAQRCVRHPEVIDHWLNAWATAGRCPRLTHGLSNPDDIGFDYQFTTRRAMARSAYYRDLGSLDAAFYLALRARDERATSGGLTCAMALLYDRRHGHAEKGDVALARRLLPHFQRATRFALTARAATAEAVSTVLASASRGVVTTDGGGRVLFANEMAERIFSRGDGPSVTGGYLVARRHADTLALRDLIASSALGAAEGHCPGGELTLPAEDGMPCYAVEAAPLPIRSEMFPSLGARAVVLITPLRTASAASATRLRQLHGLTEREAEVALLLLDGHKPAAIGETLGISVRGVRFHLKNCYAKLGVPGQAALVALLARSLRGA